MSRLSFMHFPTSHRFFQLIIIIIKKDIYCPTYNKPEWPGFTESI